MMSAIGAYLPLFTLASAAPAIFRCARPGMLANLLTAAGLRQVQQAEITHRVEFASFNEYWQNMMQIAAPVVAILRQTDAATHLAIKQLLFTALADKAVAGKIFLPCGPLLLIAGKA